MDPIQSHLLTVGITLLVVVVIYVVFYFKPKAEPVVEETLEALALKEFQTLQYLISKQKQDIAARQAALAASQARFASAKNEITSMTV